MTPRPILIAVQIWEGMSVPREGGRGVSLWWGCGLELCEERLTAGIDLSEIVDYDGAVDGGEADAVGGFGQRCIFGMDMGDGNEGFVLQSTEGKHAH